MMQFRMGSREEGERKAYAEFREKVRRTVFIDCISPAVTVPILKAAIGQFGKVRGVSIVPNFPETVEMGAVPQSALVEMEKEAQARAVVEEMSNLPYMISGMPRPVRARPAREDMFWDRPRNPDRRRIAACWLEDPGDPEFAAAQRLRQLADKQAMERAALLQYQLEEEQKLDGRQQAVLRSNLDKYELIDGVVRDGSLRRLAAHYGIGGEAEKEGGEGAK